MPGSPEKTFVAYYRVDGVPLAEQVRCVEGQARDDAGRILRSYRDEEPADAEDRPGLRRAIAYAKRYDASIIVATLQGLVRDLTFLRRMERSGLNFFACDMPLANASTIHVLRAIAEYEERSALVAGVRRGNLDAAAREKGARRAGEVLKAQADAAYLEVAPLIRELRAAGFTLQEISDRLNEAGRLTRRGRPWNPMQVSRVLERSGGG